MAPGPIDKVISYPKLYFNFPEEPWATSSLWLLSEHMSSGISLSHSASLSSHCPISSFEIRYPFFKRHLLSLQVEEVQSLCPFLGLINVGASAGGVEVLRTGLRAVVSWGKGGCDFARRGYWQSLGIFFAYHNWDAVTYTSGHRTAPPQRGIRAPVLMGEGSARASAGVRHC